MKKRIFPLTLVLVMSLMMVASAIEPRYSETGYCSPDISINGTYGLDVEAKSDSTYITADLYVYRVNGNSLTQVASATGLRGWGRLEYTGYYSPAKGQTYMVAATVTVGSENLYKTVYCYT